MSIIRALFERISNVTRTLFNHSKHNANSGNNNTGQKPRFGEGGQTHPNSYAATPS